MNDLLQLDIFFFITSTFIVLLCIFLIIVGIYAIRIIRRLSTIVRLAEEEAYEIKDDIDVARSNIKKLTSLTNILAALKKLFDRR
ncbi:MAG: hypothetical protein ACI9AR_000435 [Flavobacteriaceae bacterium]|jgi:uncharacterized protein YoxC